MSLRPGLLWLALNLALIIQCLSRFLFSILHTQYDDFVYPRGYVHHRLKATALYETYGIAQPRTELPAPTRSRGRKAAEEQKGFRQPLCSRVSSWLQIQWSGFHSRRYQTF
jgi:hypothetical protein